MLIMLPLILMTVTSAVVLANVLPAATSAVSPTQAASNSTADLNPGYLGIGSGLAIGLAAIGGGVGIGISGAAAIAVLAEKPEVFFRAFIIVILADAVAIYGFVIAILLYIKI